MLGDLVKFSKAFKGLCCLLTSTFGPCKFRQIKKQNEPMKKMMMMKVMVMFKNQNYIQDIIEVSQRHNARWEISQPSEDFMHVSVIFPEKPKFFQETNDLEETWEDLIIHVGERETLGKHKIDLKRFMIDRLNHSSDYFTVVTKKGYVKDVCETMEPLKEVNVRFEQDYVKCWGKLSVRFRGDMSDSLYDSLEVADDCKQLEGK